MKESSFMRDFSKKYSYGIWFTIIISSYLLSIVFFRYFVTGNFWIFVGISLIFITLLYLKHRELVVTPLRQLSREIDLFAE
jgi:hypothetical protein